LRVSGLRMKATLVPKKYLICIPQDGLNDMLNRIWFCYQYALRFKRILVIDTRKSPGFKDDFSKYFIFKSSIFYKGNIDTLYDTLYGKSIYPNELSSLNLRHLKENPEPYLKFNPTKLYFETVLVSYPSGGGMDAIFLLKECSLATRVLDKFNERKVQLPSSYTSLHIRNTDYVSDVVSFLTKIKISSSDIFLASDNASTIELCKTTLSQRVHAFSSIPRGNEGQNIHIDLRTKLNNEDLNIDSIVDLLLLAGGSELHISLEKSGYSQLALSLHKDKEVLKNLTI
jgi:hypothetical protein